MLESELVDKFIELDCSNIFEINSNMQRLNEVQIDSKIADLIFFDNDIEKIIAIEFKIRKWKLALQQASNYQLWASKSYIALPKRYIKVALKHKESFRHTGVGLLSVSNQCMIEIEAESSQYLNESYVQLAKKVIKNRLGGV